MDHLPRPPATTAEIPHLNRRSLECADFLQKNVSPLGVIDLILPKLREEAQELSNGKWKNFFGNTLDLLKRRMEPNSIAWVLLHSIPRPVLQSLILRTVAYDHHQSGHPLCGEGYEFDTGSQPGVYALGISIDGRQGRFLTGNEMETLYEDMKRYLSCYDHVYMARKRRTRINQTALDFIAEVDTVYGEVNGDEVARFVNSSSRPGLGKLVETLKKAHGAAMAADPTGNTVMIQSPGYVGCSANLARRRTDYIPSQNRSSLTRCNKPYALTMSLLSRRGLQPKLHFTVAIRTWETGQLTEAETLVSLLAGSYVNQYGFNMKATGDAADPKYVGHSERYVKVNQPHFRQNLA